MSKEKSTMQKGKPPAGGKQEERGYWPRIIVKFHDFVDIPYEDGVEKYLEKLKIGPWERLAKEYPGLTMKKLYTALKPEQIRSFIGKAVELDRKYTPPNMLTYFLVDCPPGVVPEVLVKALQEWPTVQIAYFDPPGSEPQLNPDDDPRFGNQGYLDPEPDGIDAEFAWPRADGTGFAGGDGAGISVIDLERGWTLTHEDLNAHGATLLHGTIRNGSRAHGTSVLGELCAVDNALGCVGIAPNVASVDVVSYWNSTRSNAILAAIANLQFGDLLLLEAQLDPAGGADWYPIEVLDAEFDTIRLATALGIVVVEAAGNGSNDLDAYTNPAGDQILNRGSADYRDSGAIVVGAASSAAPHTRMGFSNFGSRVDCYAWGQNVDTCSSNDAGSTTMYTGTFNGTSSASPILTGAALVVQGVAEANLGYRFSPHQVRAILSDAANGTASNNPAVDRIGVMPDLRAILQNNVLNLAPDVYIRDFVGDTGEAHTGSISASPDIILRSATVPDPQTAFGEGSGTENSNTLGYEAESGQDNYIYVRMRNRGGSDAANVTATIFWAPVATLITPDLWTLVGTVTLPNVPTGDILTVSPPTTWLEADIPAAGHYCLVGIIGNAEDPAPDPADFLNWDNFRRFIRDNNNVTWRNFNVVDNVPDPRVDPDFVVLPFLALGTPDKARRMRLEVVAKLPQKAEAFIEVPVYIQDTFAFHTPFMKLDKRREISRVPVNPHGNSALEELLFPAKFRAKLRLMVHIPKEARKNEYEVYVRQLFGEEEVGRVTWRLVPPERTRGPDREKKK
jgi:serine protease